MTDSPADTALTERIQRLQARRAPQQASAADVQRPRTRRRPGAATRILLAGLSVTGFFSIVTALGVARRNAAPVVDPAASAPVAAAPAPTSPPVAATPAAPAAASSGSAQPASPRASASTPTPVVAPTPAPTPAPAPAPAPTPITTTRGS